MSEPITVERYCAVCSGVLGPEDDPRGFHRGSCAQSVHSVTRDALSTVPVLRNTTPSTVRCQRCGILGRHSPEACRQRRYRQRKEQT